MGPFWHRARLAQEHWMYPMRPSLSKGSARVLDLSMTDTITIAHRFRGPSTSANGGYVSGYLSRFVDGAAEVTLRAPPSLDRPLHVSPVDGGAELRDGATLLAQAVPTVVEEDVPDGITWAQAEAARADAYDFGNSDFNECFTCSRNRDPQDALCLWAGPVAGRSDRMHATPWVVQDTLEDLDGAVAPEFVWAALDCPGVHALAPTGVVGQYTLLGRMACRIFERPRRGDRCIVASWPGASEGRKHFAQTALFSEEGVLLAKARQTWITVQDA